MPQTIIIMHPLSQHLHNSIAQMEDRKFTFNWTAESLHHVVEELEHLVHLASAFVIEVFSVAALPGLDLGKQCHAEGLGQELQRAHAV